MNFKEIQALNAAAKPGKRQITETGDIFVAREKDGQTKLINLVTTQALARLVPVGMGEKKIEETHIVWDEDEWRFYESAYENMQHLQALVTEASAIFAEMLLVDEDELSETELADFRGTLEDKAEEFMAKITAEIGD